MRLLNKLTLAFALAATVLAGAACGDDDDGFIDPTSADPAGAISAVASAVASAAAAGGSSLEGKEGTARAVADGKATELGVSQCLLSATGPIVIVSTATNASLSLGGTNGSATIQFLRDGVQWIAAGAKLQIAGRTVKYSGTSITPGNTAAKLEVEVNCK